jgi:hypothetical protein
MKSKNIMSFARSEIMSKLVSDSHCENCVWYPFKGQKNRTKNDVKQGACPFVRCVKRYGFTADHKRRNEN